MADDVGSTSHLSGQRVWDPPLPEDLNARIPDLEVEALIGRGGMAAVYRVRHAEGTSAAIKLLPGELANDPILTKRFAGEIQILTSLDHPKLIKAHRHSTTTSGEPYYLMDDMAGGDLGSIGILTPEQGVNLVDQVCEGLAHLHDQGLLHRDLKPSNILLSEDLSQVKIADFGLAKKRDLDLSQMSLTRTGTQVGSPHFLAPELYLNSGLESIQSDLYSLGVILYQILAGKLPIGHFQMISTIAGIPKSADPFMMRALSAEPESRFSSAKDFQGEMHKAFQKRPPLSRRQILTGSAATAACSLLAWQQLRPAPPRPLVPGTSKTPLFKRPITRPWTSTKLWPDMTAEQMVINEFIAGEEAHLIHFTPKTSAPLVPEFHENTFPGKSLTLESSSSLILAGFPGKTHIDNLRLDGGTITSDLVRMISAEEYPQLYAALGDFTGSTGTLTGKINILQTSTFTTGLAGKNKLIIASDIIGKAPIFIAPPREGVGVKFQGDNSKFSGGWFVQGDLEFDGPHAAGPGAITIDRGSLRLRSECTLGPVKLLDNGDLYLLAPTTMKSLVINGEPIAPGRYANADDLGYPNLEGKAPFTILSTGGTTPDLFLPRVTVLKEQPRVVTARQSGRWDRAETWDGPMPTRARHDENGLTVPAVDYRVPDGIVINGTYDPRGLEYFGGNSLTLEKGSVLEPEGNVGFLAFPELRLAGGTVRFGTRHSLFARELVGGRFLVQAPTLFRLPDLPHLQPKDFVLQGKITGSHPLLIQGDREEFVYLNADTSEYTGQWKIMEGSLTSVRNDVFTHASVTLEGGNCWLRCYNDGPTPLRRLDLTLDGRIEPKKAALKIGEMYIDGKRVPDGVYDERSPEMRRVLLAGVQPLTVGPPPTS
ncbi:serine/threonine-protein kinase [Verrucomicrobiaceae bacterium 227]